LNRRNWEPGFLAAAGVLGGSFLYLNGLQATAHLGGLKVGVDVCSGLCLQKALQNEGTARRLAALELAYAGKPITLKTEWGLGNGNLRNERVALEYRRRF
jgi:hypothetical protein